MWNRSLICKPSLSLYLKKAHKIRYMNILTIDGQEPNELAAVYGLGPKTARFKRRKAE